MARGLNPGLDANVVIRAFKFGTVEITESPVLIAENRSMLLHRVVEDVLPHTEIGRVAGI